MTQLPMYMLLDFQKSLKEEVSVVDGMVYTHTHPATPTHTHTHTEPSFPRVSL